MTADPRMLGFVAGHRWGVLATLKRDGDEYRAAMVTDRRLVVRFRPEHTYGQLPD